MEKFSVPWKKSLKLRLTLIIAFVSLFTGSIMLLFLAGVFQNRIDKEFKDKALLIAKTTTMLIDAETIDHYLTTLEIDEEYDRILARLKEKQQETGIKYIIITRIFEHGEIYVFDTDDDEEEHVALGETIIWMGDEIISDVLPQILKGESVEPLIQRTRWGWLLFAVEPIFREDGSVAAHATACISMDDVLMEQRTGLVLLGIIVLAIFIFSVMINLYIIRKFVISPIRKISQGVTSYHSGSEQLVNLERPKSPVMRYGDELELLERVIIDMESRVFLSMEAERRASSVKNAFLTNMSHELRTPLNSTINMIREAMAAPDHNKSMIALDQAIASSNDLLSVLNTILEISNIESGEFFLSHSPFRMDEVTNDINNLISTLCKAKNIIWEPRANIPKDISVEGDRIRLMQVLTIMLRNAVKFAREEQGMVSFVIGLLSETDETAWIRFEVYDNGIGMTEKKLNELSQMFSLDNDYIHYSSSEIMLSTCNRIVKMMGSQIKVKSEAGKGSYFSFALAFPKAVMPVQPEEIETSNIDFTGKNVLVVDDVLINRVVLKHILASTGINVLEAKDGKQAVRVFLDKSESIDLILMDIMMPKMDGYEASQEIRTSDLPNAKTVPIIAVTSLTYQEDVDAAINAGMNFHIGKPVEPKLLLSALKRFIQP